MLMARQLRGDSIALTKGLLIAVSAILPQRACPLSHAAGVTAPPKGEPLACRATFRWTLEAQYGIKYSALLQRFTTA